MNNELPESLHRFFWEYDPTTIRLNEHSHLIMLRLMERGTWETIKKNFETWVKKLG